MALAPSTELAIALINYIVALHNKLYIQTLQRAYCDHCMVPKLCATPGSTQGGHAIQDLPQPLHDNLCNVTQDLLYHIHCDFTE